MFYAALSKQYKRSTAGAITENSVSRWAAVTGGKVVASALPCLRVSYLRDGEAFRGKIGAHPSSCKLDDRRF